MILRKSMKRLFLVCAFCAASAVQAATAPFAVAQTRFEVINGATCKGDYAPYGYANPHTFYLLVGPFQRTANDTVFCYLTMSYEWPVTKLKLVHFSIESTGTTKVRLCVHSGLGFGYIVTCSSSKPIPPGTLASWVDPPTLPYYANIGFGAYVEFTAAALNALYIRELNPHWEK